jgi:hypothetical protein
MLQQILTTILLTVIITYILLQIPNNSNFSSVYIIPVITALIVKYVLGDWDRGYQWSLSDVVYWLSIIGTSTLITISFK